MGRCPNRHDQYGEGLWLRQCRDLPAGGSVVEAIAGGKAAAQKIIQYLA